MKRLILAVLLPFVCFYGYSQNTIFGFWGGASTSVNYNYDMGLSGGFSFIKYGWSRMGLGADLFYQGYAFKYDREANGMKNGTGSAGMIILNKSSYIFVTPKFSMVFGGRGTHDAYLTVGAGFKMGGKETMHKWDHTLGATSGDFDSTNDTSPNINSMVLRIGAGMTHMIYISRKRQGKWWFTISEDIGFVPSSLTKSSDVTDPSRTAYSPAGKLNPFFVSVRIGLRHLKNVGLSVPPRKRTNLGY